MNKNTGFTLIEVLVALAIISIALTAVMKISSQNIKNTLYVHEKTIALWVASDIVNEIRAGLINIPGESTVLQDKIEMLNQSWSYTASLINTPNPRIKEINVSVFLPQKSMKLAHLESYLYEQ